jgi:hypothetical protein
MVTNSTKENFIKNSAILIIAAFLWPIISNALDQIKPEQSNDFLLIISMLLVTVCFANFAFTYEKSKLSTMSGKLLSHGATFIFMLLIALLLESMILAIKVVYPSFYAIIFSFSLLLYAGIIMYDFWDYLRVER